LGIGQIEGNLKNAEKTNSEVSRLPARVPKEAEDRNAGAKGSSYDLKTVYRDVVRASSGPAIAGDLVPEHPKGTQGKEGGGALSMGERRESRSLAIRREKKESARMTVGSGGSGLRIKRRTLVKINAHRQRSITAFGESGRHHLQDAEGRTGSIWAGAARVLQLGPGSP